MLYNRLWDCLGFDAQLCLFGFQRDNHDAGWMPDATVKKNLTVETRGRENVPAIMQATPADVKHNRGAFA